MIIIFSIMIVSFTWIISFNPHVKLNSVGAIIILIL